MDKELHSFLLLKKNHIRMVNKLVNSFFPSLVGTFTHSYLSTSSFTLSLYYLDIVIKTLDLNKVDFGFVKLIPLKDTLVDLTERLDHIPDDIPLYRDDEIG